jgi:predicted transcriptional regulator
MHKSTIILPIKSIFVKEIIAGRKLYEFRKSFPSEEINKILIYESSPISMIVAEAHVEQLKMNVSDLINIDIDIVTKEVLSSYYGDRREAFIYKIVNIHVFEEKKRLLDYGFASAPQNFFYLK